MTILNSITNLGNGLNGSNESVISNSTSNSMNLTNNQVSGYGGNGGGPLKSWGTGGGCPKPICHPHPPPPCHPPFRKKMEISLLEIQKYYNEFQDIKSEIDHYYEESSDQFEKILDFCSKVEGNNIDDESASSTNTPKTTTEQQQQLLIGIKEPIESIRRSIESINNNLNKLNNLLEISKKLVHINNLIDLNIISNRGKTKLELSITDLIEFMTITYNNYEQDYQMKQILFDDIKDYKNGNTSNITIDKLNNTIPMWQSKSLMDLSQQQYVTQRIQLFSTILKLSK
ncbi:hypothetical protein RB653_005896 [Dictyostelium firmibasis]|uniref:Uncharacterized protein n=1 Tax=Dictyostelium firmibasis TaxID=79012 RepID=A0AAN7U826_9MYCE